jgi:outer membrane lipopolysaccharide assembly protein LptE/RlpB
MKNITLIILVLFLYNCGYSSIYKNQKIQNFKIKIVELKGDREMNNLIKNEIRLYSNKDSTNIYNLKIDTKYKKEILTKNTSGVITDYTLSVESVFEINSKGKNQIIKIIENINIKNQPDSFEQNIYEKNIKRNFASSIREKLISKILNLNDN